MSGKSGKMRRTTKKYGGSEGYGIVQGVKRAAKPFAMTGQAINQSLFSGHSKGEDERMRRIAAWGLDKNDERRERLENNGYSKLGGKSKKLRKSSKTRRRSNKKRSTKRSRK